MLSQRTPRAARRDSTAPRCGQRRDAGAGRSEAPQRCSCGGCCPRCKPPRLLLRPEHDRWEQEADAAASALAGGRESRSHRGLSALSEPESTTGAAIGAPELTPQALASSVGRPLDRPLRDGLAAKLGSPLDDVRIHDDAFASALSRRLAARAFTAGRDIFFASGEYRPRQAHGRWLLMHELAHVVQQRQRASAATGLQIQRSGFSEVRDAEELLDPGSLRGLAVDRDHFSLWFEFDSALLRSDSTVNSVADLAELQRAAIYHGQAMGDDQEIDVHGYASEEGDQAHNLDLSRQRAEAVAAALVAAGVAAGHVGVHAHGVDQRFADRGANRRVDVELTPTITRVEMPAGQVTGSACRCDPSAQGPIAQWAIDYITEIAPTIAVVAEQRDIPPLALAGAIAEEYDSRRLPHSFIDFLQDNVIPLYPEWAIDFGRVPDFHNKAQNLLEHDIGRANLHIRTALEQVEAGRVSVRGSPPNDAQINLIVAYLLKTHGMVDTAGAVIEQGQDLFAPYIASFDSGTQEAVLVDFYNVGKELYFDRNFQNKLAADPLHRPCADPAGDGCQVMLARDAIEAAYAAGLPP